MTDKSTIAHICGHADALVDVLFVHGLTGTALETWSVDGDYWPKWLCKDLPGLGIYAIGYPAGLFEKWAKKEMNLHERAGNILEHLAGYGFGERPIVLISHSLGGILVKEILRASGDSTDEDLRRIAENTRLAAFFATPHTGASLAATVNFLVPRLASKFVDLLSNDAGYLTSLNHAFRELARSQGIETISYYEKWKTKDIALVVTPESADPGVGTSRPVAVDADHISIVKPRSVDDVVYLSLKRRLRKLLLAAGPGPGSTPSSFGVDDYGTASPSDRRDLLQKMIDAGRETEYQIANDYQNKFAQKYYRLGLFTDERQRSDAFLSLVQQRFSMHVYGHICRNAPDEEVKSLLQAHVIDPICGDPGQASRPSPNSVLQALYFLTEQCHIRWDRPC